jgi:hypothetical protein
MQLIQVGSRFLNPAHLVCVRRHEDGTVEALLLCVAVPAPTPALGGRTVPGAAQPTAPGHHVEWFHGDEAALLWKQLAELA